MNPPNRTPPTTSPALVRPGWPGANALTGPVELAAERPVTTPPPPPGMRVGGYVRTLDGTLCPHYVPDYQPPAPPVPARGMDPLAQRMAAGGLLAAGVGAGSWLLLSALAGAALSIGALALLLIACKLPTNPARGDTHITTVHNHNRWWGHSSTHTR